MPKPRIAFLGTGIMGLPMAQNLLAAGYPLTACNRTPAKAEALAVAGASIADSPREAARDAEFVFVMVADAAAADAVLFGDAGAAESFAADSCVIVGSSMTPGDARGQAARCKSAGAAYLDAQVSGGEAGAKAGNLAIMVGGGESVFARAKELLQTLGAPTRIGPVGCGQLAKLANQAIVGAGIAAVAEALILAAAGGADPAAVREALLGGFADSAILRQHGARMIAGDTAPGGPAKYQLRDLQNAAAEADSHGVNTPMMDAAAAMFAAMIDGGYGEKDHSALYEFWRGDR